MPDSLRTLAALLALCLASLAGGARADQPPPAGAPTPLIQEFAAMVGPRLLPPSDVAAEYALALDRALAAAAIEPAGPRFIVQVDRSANVQALLLWWGRPGAWRLVGSTPVSTGVPGRYDHFKTPLGVFDHSLRDPDFRAEGTKNALGIRGYGRKGTRIYDFGWVVTEKGWGDRRPMAMRLQMHATDPDRLEQRLGTAQSKGCIRIPASLNEFLDRFAVLDEDYDLELATGRRLWVLRQDRTPTPWSGRYLVVMDSLAAARPQWASTASRAAVTTRPGTSEEDAVC